MKKIYYHVTLSHHLIFSALISYRQNHLFLTPKIDIINIIIFMLSFSTGGNDNILINLVKIHDLIYILFTVVGSLKVFCSASLKCV